MKSELELRQLRAFVAVVESGGHTRAARALGVSQSTVSETLSALERALGTTLLRKTPKGAQLSASGEALLPYAKRTLALTGELVNALAKVSTDVSAKLCVAAVESISTYVLPPLLANLRERWPGARVEVSTCVCSEIRASVAAGRCDLGLVLESEHGQHDASVLARSRLLIVGSPAHPLARGKALPDDLQRYDFYLSDTAGDFHQILRQHFESAQLPLPRIQALGTIEAVKRGLLADGAALGLLPSHAVCGELREASLVEIPIRPALRGLVMRAIGPMDSARSPLADDLERALRQSVCLAARENTASAA